MIEITVEHANVGTVRLVPTQDAELWVEDRWRDGRLTVATCCGMAWLPPGANLTIRRTDGSMVFGSKQHRQELEWLAIRETFGGYSD